MPPQVVINVHQGYLQGVTGSIQAITRDPFGLDSGSHKGSWIIQPELGGHQKKKIHGVFDRTPDGGIKDVKTDDLGSLDGDLQRRRDRKTRSLTHRDPMTLK